MKEWGYYNNEMTERMDSGEQITRDKLPYQISREKLQPELRFKSQTS